MLDRDLNHIDLNQLHMKYYIYIVFLKKILMKFQKNKKTKKILPQRFDEFKNVPAGQTHADIFQIFAFLHVQFPVHCKSTVELH